MSLLSNLMGGSSGKSQSSSTPVNMQNPSYTGLAPSVAGSLTSLFGGGSPFLGINSALANNIATGAGTPNIYSPANNPFTAPLTFGQTGLVNQGTAQGQPTPQLDQSSQLLSTMLNPGYPLSLVNSPVTQGAIQASVNPVLTAFTQSTMPGLQGQFVQAGQSINPNAGPANPAGGSSAFDRASALAQTGLQQAIAAATSNIVSNAFNTGLQQQTNAVNQAQGISQTELANTMQSLQAASLPQIIQQYGINQGLQVFQQRMQTLLTALGLGGQVSQPVVANNQTSTGSFSSSPDFLSGVGNILSGGANFFGAPASGGLSPFQRLVQAF